MSHHPNPSRNTSQASQMSVEPHLQTHIAAFRNDVGKLKRLMEEEGAPLLDEESLETPLHVAARCGSDAVIKYLLETSDPSAALAKAVNGSTPAHYAAIYGQLSSLKLLLECGENDVALEKDTQGLTVLHLASLKGDEQIVEYLLKEFRELEDIPNEAEDYPIHFASASGHITVVKTFVKLCGKEVITREDINGTLPVYFAAQEGKLAVLRYLIVDVGADPVARDNDGLTTLHAATQGGHLNVVQWLVSELGEEFIIDETQDGATPIHIAAAMGYPDILEWFFKRKEGKSYVNLLDRNKRTPCHDAAEYGNLEALIILLKYGARINEKDNDGKTPLMLAEEHKEISNFIMEYNKEGAKILSQYENSVITEDYAENDDINDQHASSSSNHPVRTSRTEHVELVSALNELSEVQEYRLRRQESLQAIENELKTENEQDKPPRKKSKKSSSGLHDKPSRGNGEIVDPDHYIADSGDIYARSRKQRSSRPGSGNAKKSPGAHVASREMERKKSPPSHWYNGVAEDSSHDNRSRSHHRRHDAEDEMGSVYSYISSGSRPHAPHSVQLSAYSGHSMASAYRHGHFVPFPGYGYGNYGYPMYPGPRGYPGPVGYPPMYPPYGYPPPPPMMNRQRPPQHSGRGSDGKQRRPNQPLHSVTPQQTAGDAPRGRKAKTKSPPIDYAAHETKGEQMIGYGPDLSDDKAMMNQNNEDPDFHPLPPPITTKDGEMKDYVTTEDQNFIMIKRTNQSQAATVHPSGLQLNPAKQPFVYDGRYDKYIEPDDDWEEADIKYGVPVLAACAAIVGIGVVTGLKGVARSMKIGELSTTPAHATKDRAYESIAWDSTTVGSAQVGGKLQKKISTSSLHGNLLYDSVDDMDTEELDPIEYSLREESGLTHTKADSNLTGKLSPPPKKEYKSATLPSKRKAIMQMDFSDDNFAKMTPQYGETADDSQVDQVGGGLGESLQSRNASMLDLAPSGFRDGEEVYDSEELEGVENIVHRSIKNSERSKESRSNREESKDVTNKKENSKVHKEKKKKEKMKGRNEKKTLASLQPSPSANPEKLSVTAATTNAIVSTTNTTISDTAATMDTGSQREKTIPQQTVADVQHSTTEVDHASSTSITSSQDTSQLLDQVETSQSQINLLTGQTSSQQAIVYSATSQVESSPKASLESSNIQRQAGTAEKSFWHVTMESYDTQKATNQATMEQAIAHLTSASKQPEKAVNSQDVTEPTSVTVQLTSLQQLQQPTVVSVDVMENATHNSVNSSTTQQQQLTASTTQQESLGTHTISHQVTMEKAITQVTPYQTTSNTKSTQQANQKSVAAVTTVVTAPPVVKQSTTSIDEGNGSVQEVDSEQDFDFSDINFNDILNDLKELSGETESSNKTPALEKSTKKIPAGNQSTKKSTEYHTLSLFSDVPITVPAHKTELTSKQEFSQRTATVRNDEMTKQSKATNKSLNPVTNSDSTAMRVKPDEVTRKESSPPLAAAVPNIKESTKSIAIAATKPAEISLTKQQTPTTSLAVTSSKESSVSMATKTSAEGAAGKHNVPLAISHKKEMQQQKDGTDLEWGIDLGDIDTDLASQLEELNSIIGQLGVEPIKDEQEAMSNNKMEQHDVAVTPHNAAVVIKVDQSSTSDVHQLKPEATPVTAAIDNNLIATLSHVNSKVASNVQLTKEETILLYETRKKVVTNIVEYCQTICKGDKSAALNLALTLSTTYNLDAATISEISTFINTGVYTEIGVMPPTISKLMPDPNSGKSGSAISLLSTEAEQALLKQQEEHMKTTERHFQEQAMVQSDLKKQLLEQSKLQQEAQRQSLSFAEAQSRQSRLLEEAQKQVQEQAERLRQSELKLKEAEFISKEKAMESDRERILREAQEQQRRAQIEYEEKNKLIVTMQNQLKEMQEFQQKLMQRFEEQDQAHVKKIEEYQQKLARAEASGKRVRIQVSERDSDSEEEPMMTAVGPSLQREIMAHAELRAMEAQIQKTQPLSYRLMAEENIPGAPPVPNVDTLLDNKTRLKKRTSTIKAAERSASVFDKFEKGSIEDDDDVDEDDDDDEMQFAQPKLISQGAREAKTALIKHKTSSHSVEIPDHGYYRSTYSIPPTTKPANMKTFEKMPGEFQMRHYKVPQ